jgi:AraC-like DNA-binding protein
MYLSLLSLLIGFALIMLLPILFLRKRTDKNINPYLFILFAIGGVQRFLSGLISLEIIGNDANPFQKNLYFVYIVIIVHYLFFKNLLSKKTSFLNDAKLFLIGILIVFLLVFFNVDRRVHQIVFLIYSSIYLGIILKIIVTQLFNKKNKKELIQFNSIKNWVLIMFGHATFTYLIANYLFIVYINESAKPILIEYNKYSSVIWIVIIAYILKNPNILYGSKLLLQKINSSNVGDINIWKNKKTKITAKNDLELERRILPKIERMLYKIRKLEDSLFLNFQHVPSLKELSLELKYPETHIKYIFKYFSNFTYSEYQNALKIQYALQLIKNGYLESKTIDALSEKCLFNSRMNFYNNFKKITGYSVSSYNAINSEE